MAEYCTKEQLSRWGISGDALAGVTVGEQDDAIKSASDKIDSYLKARWTIPLLSYGEDISRCCAIIAVYDIILVRGTDGASWEVLQKRYDQEIAWLKEIAAGTVTPDVTGGAPVTPATTPIGAPMVSSCEQRGYYTTSSSAGAFTRRRG